ncbi:hypothetical protein B0T20DRAFT_320440, partial [Sordaria brevicollis]
EWETYSPWKLAQHSKSKLAYLLMDKEAQTWHSWLFDALDTYEAYCAAQDAIGDNTEAKVFEALVNKCRDLDPKERYGKEKQIRKIRMKVLIIFFREADPRFLEDIHDLEAHEMDQCLINKFREALRYRWRENR